jgi:hypothetical protein
MVAPAACYLKRYLYFFRKSETGSITHAANVFAVLVSPGFVAAIFWAVKGTKENRRHWKN